MQLKSADGIYKDNSKRAMLYVCSNYPECDAYVCAHAGTSIPAGTMANHTLRRLRIAAHTGQSPNLVTATVSKARKFLRTVPELKQLYNEVV